MRENSVVNQKDCKRICLLPEISKGSPEYLLLKVYFFGTPQYTKLPISKAYTVENLIMHILALTDINPQIKGYFEQELPKEIRGNYKCPELYEMRLLEDEDDPDEAYIPFYTAGPLDRGKPIGAFLVTGVALCRSKDYEETIRQLNISNHPTQ